MKILFVFPSINAGGAEKASILYANEFVKLNYDIDIVVFNESDFYKELIDEKINVTYLSNIYKNNVFDPIRSYIKFPLLLSKYYLGKKYDFIISIHEYFGEWPIIILKKLKLFNSTKFVSIIQRSILYGKNEYFSSKLKSLLERFISNSRKVIFDLIICVSNEIYNSIEHKNKYYLPNPISINEINKKLDTDIHNMPIKLDDYFINVGRICKQKNQILLINCWIELIKRGINEKLIIIGEVTEKVYLEFLYEKIKENNLSDHIFILPPQKNYYNILKNSKAHLFSSKFEGMPLALLETMFVKVPIITTKFIGHEAFLSEDKCIFYKSEKELEKIIIDYERIDFNEKINNAKVKIRDYHIDELANRFNMELLRCQFQ